MVHVQWPVLSRKEFVALAQQRMLWEICGDESGVPGGRDVSCSQLVGGIGPLRIGKQARVCVNVLFRNPREKKLTILAGDVHGYAKLAGQVYINPEWYQALESRNLVHAVDSQLAVGGAASTEQTQQLVEQLGIMDNRLLSQHPEVRLKLINILSRYESVFTDSDVAVGKTDVLKMKIVLQDDVTPVRSAVREIKPVSQQPCQSWKYTPK